MEVLKENKGFLRRIGFEIQLDNDTFQKLKAWRDVGG